MSRPVGRWLPDAQDFPFLERDDDAREGVEAVPRRTYPEKATRTQRKRLGRKKESEGAAAPPVPRTWSPPRTGLKIYHPDALHRRPRNRTNPKEKSTS